MTNVGAGAAGEITIGGDLRVARMGYGALKLVGRSVWPSDFRRATPLLRRAVELGIRFIDTANVYGAGLNEIQIAQALYPYPEGLVIATKAGMAPRERSGAIGIDCHPVRLRQRCDESLERLALDCIDLYQLHVVDPKVPWEEQVGAMKSLRDAGKIRHVGLSNVTLDLLRAAESVVPIASVQNKYSVAFRENDEVVGYCAQRGIAFIPFAPLDRGEVAALKVLNPIAAAHGASVHQVALAWLLRRSPVILPIPGTVSLAHLEENVGAASLRLTEEEYARLTPAH